MYEFYVVNFDQIESEKDIRTNDYISKLKKGAIVKKVDIRLDRDYEKVFDNLKKINFDIGDKDFNYSRSVKDVSKGLKDLIPKNFISYDLNPDEKEEGPQEIPIPEKHKEDEGEDDDDDDELEIEEKPISQMPVEIPESEMKKEKQKQVRKSKNSSVLLGDDDDDDDDDDDYIDDDDDYSDSDELEIREKPVPSPNDEFEETPIRQTKSSDEIFKRKRKRFDPSYLDIPDVQEPTEEPTDRSEGDYEKFVSERMNGSSKSNITKSAHRVSAPVHVKPRIKPKALMPPPVNREPKNQNNEIMKDLKALMASRLFDTQLLSELMKRTEGMEELKTKLEEMKSRIESSSDQYNRGLQSIGKESIEHRGLYEQGTASILSAQNETAKGIEKFYQNNQENQQAINSKLDSINAKVGSLDSAYGALVAKPQPTIQTKVTIPKDGMDAINQSTQRTINTAMVPHVSSLKSAISDINKGIGEVARVVKEIKEIKDSEAASLDAIRTQPKILEPLEGIRESIDGNRSALDTINKRIGQAITNTDGIIRGVSGVLISVSRAVIPKIEETGRNTQLAIEGVQTIQERNQDEIKELFKQSVQTINVYFKGTYDEFIKYFSETFQPAINGPMSDGFKATQKLITDGLAEERGATSEALGKLSTGLITHFDTKTGKIEELENETKGIIEAQGKEIAEIKKVAESIFSRMENGTYDKSIVDDIKKILPSVNQQQVLAASQGNVGLAQQLEGFNNALRDVLKEQEELKAQQEKYLGKFDELEGKFDTFSDKFDAYDKRLSDFSDKYDKDQEERRLLRERKAQAKAAKAKRKQEENAEVERRSLGKAEPRLLRRRHKEILDSISAMKKNTSPVEAKPPKQEPDYGLFGERSPSPPPPPYPYKDDPYDDDSVGDDGDGNNGFNGHNGSSSGSSSSGSSSSSDSDSDRMTDDEEEEEKPKKKKKPKKRYLSFDDSSDLSEKLKDMSSTEKLGYIMDDSSDESVVEVKPKKKRKHIRNNGHDFNVLAFSVDLQRQTNGRITKEKLGEFIDMNGELTEMADEIGNCNKKIKRARNKAERDKLKKKRDELVKKYHSKLNDYAKQLYKESIKRKTKATIATHKYLMNKLNKLN